MKRRFSTRDLGLTCRLTVALGGIALIYTALLAFAAWLFVGATHGDDPRGFFIGPGIVAFSLFALHQQYYRASAIVVRALRARPDARTDALSGVLARMAAQADLLPPTLLLSDIAAANSLSAPTRKLPIVVVTSGLLDRLGPREVEAVLAHEVSHLANGDGKVMVFAGGPALALSGMWHDDLRGKLFAALFSPVWLVALLLMRAISRYREFTADRGSALLTGAPEQLMSALAKLHDLDPRGDLRGSATSALCIRSLIGARSALLRDHPPVEKRLAALEAIARDMGRPVA